MEFINTPIENLLLIKPEVFSDSRGLFFESYNADIFKKNGLNINFVQDNQSISEINVLRGMHFQKPPFMQAKLVRVIKGAVIDVVVDLRKNSKTYGTYFSAELNDENQLMMLIPEGFAHGFLSLANDTIFHYKCSNFYSKQSEGGILWNDKTIDVKWGVENPIVSDKDLVLPAFNTSVHVL